jgi:hypothetical protein
MLALICHYSIDLALYYRRDVFPSRLCHMYTVLYKGVLQ